jgi:hypothetical protein
MGRVKHGKVTTVSPQNVAALIVERVRPSSGVPT